MNDYAKQTQSNPTCSELACPELVEPVEGVEPISKIPSPKNLAKMIDSLRNSILQEKSQPDKR